MDNLVGLAFFRLYTGPNVAKYAKKNVFIWLNENIMHIEAKNRHGWCQKLMCKHVLAITHLKFDNDQIINVLLLKNVKMKSKICKCIMF